MKIKSIMSYHLTPVRMAIKKKKEKKKRNHSEKVEKKELL
jgi:hypothetical protein